jgi:hypothetical protein
MKYPRHEIDSHKLRQSMWGPYRPPRRGLPAGLWLALAAVVAVAVAVAVLRG